MTTICRSFLSSQIRRSKILRTHKKTISGTKKSSEFPINGSFVEWVKSRTGVPTIGLYAEITQSFSQDSVTKFASLCGDNNPIHIDPEAGAKSMFKGTIVHGIFVSSLFSTIFGRSVPGSIYVNQSLRFVKPVFVGSEVIARIEVTKVECKKKGNLITCSTTVRLAKCGTEAVNGEAKVLLMNVA